MEMKLPEARKAQYDNLLNSTQQLEMTIGSNQFRISKLIDMRKELEGTLKKWWDDVLVELKLEANRDYMITKDGVIQDVTKAPATPDVSVAKPASVSDLK
jgi:hypothetical protein